MTVGTGEARLVQTGTAISGAAHALFVLLLMFGGIFARDRLPPVTVADVSVISEEQFAALFAPTEAPEVETELSQPEAPEVSEPVAPSPVEEVAPEIAALPAPPEEVVPEDPGPQIEAPPPLPDRPEAPQEAAPAPAPRVAPEPAAPTETPLPDAPEVVQEAAPDPEAPPAEPETEQAAAPEEATTEIVTEAEETVVTAPAASPRPRNRPSRPAPASEPETQVAEDPTAAAIAEAVAAANSEPTPQRTPSGPPMSSGEREALRVAVQSCWVVDVGSRAADVTVTVAVTMTREGMVEGNQVRLVAAEGGDDAAQRAAYEQARRAILRCQRGGFPLPPEKYDHWNEIEMTFNPEGMRLK